MERNKKNFDEKGSKDKYVWTSLEDYQFHGFKTRPPTREKNKQQETTTAVAI